MIRFKGQSTSFLLDRVTRDPSLSTKAIETPSRRPTPSANLPEIGPLLPEDNAAFDLARKKLQDWRQALPPERRTSKALMRIIESALDQMTYLRTTHEFNLIPRYTLDDSLTKGATKIDTAILFLPKYGAIISNPVWDQQNIETQAGLLIHEACRQIQIGHAFKDLTDEQLQMIVAMIMDEAPSASVDFEKWMSPMLLHYCMVKSWAEPASDDPTLQKVAAGAVELQVMIERMVNAIQQEKSCELTDANGIPEKRHKLLQELLKNGILRE